MARQRQTQARAFDIAVLGPQAIERLAHMRELRLAHTNASVDHMHVDACLDVFDFQRHRAPRPVVLHGIGQQVHQHLPHPHAICRYPGSRPAGRCGMGPRNGDRTIDPRRSDDHPVTHGQRHDHRKGLLPLLGHIEYRGRDLNGLHIDAGDIHQVVEHFQQMTRCHLNLFDGTRVRAAQWIGRPLQQLREAKHRVERRAQLMTHPRQEPLPLAGLRFQGQHSAP